jgi:biopolymer transport protein TolQ
VVGYNKLISTTPAKLGARMEGFADEFSAILSRQIDERVGLTANAPRPRNEEVLMSE